MSKKTNLSHPPRQRESAYHHGDLRAALVAAAAELVEEKGPGLSLREVARRCGVSQAAPYRHFRSREALLAAVAAAGYRELVAEMAHHADGIETPVERLKAIATAYVTFATARPEALRLMFGAECARAGDPELAQAANDAFAVLSGTVENALQYPDAAHLPGPVVTLGVWSLVHGLARLMIDMPCDPTEVAGDDPQVRARAVIETFVGALFAGGRGGNEPG